MNYAVDSILSQNIQNINKVLEQSIENGMPIKTIYLFITIKLSNELEKNTNITNEILTGVTKLKFEINKKVKNILKDFYKKIGIKNVEFIAFNEICNTFLLFKECPITEIAVEINKIYGFYKNKIQKKIVDSKQITEVLYNENIISISGIPFMIKKETKIISRSYSCQNPNCSDKTYILIMKTLAYTFTESEKSFLLISENPILKCKKCKFELKENIKLLIKRCIYYYIISNNNSYIAAESMFELSGNCRWYIGTIKRKLHGGLSFIINQSYQSYEYKSHATIIKPAEKSIKISDYLIRIGTEILRPIKNTCDINDVILLLILTIPAIKKTSVIIFTSDSLYIKRCAHCYYNTLDVKIDILNHINELKIKKGLCVIETNDSYSKSILTYSEHVFYLHISSAFDYSYEIKEVDSSFELKKLSILNTDIKEELRLLFVEMRVLFKGVIEPTKLLDSLSLLYASIYGFTGNLYEIKEIVNLIRLYMIEKISIL